MLKCDGMYLNFKFTQEIVDWLNGGGFPGLHYVLAPGPTFMRKPDPFDQSTWYPITLSKCAMPKFSHPCDIFFRENDQDEIHPETYRIGEYSRRLVVSFCSFLCTEFPNAKTFYLHSIDGKLQMVDGLSHVETMSPLRKVGAEWLYLGAAF